MRVVLDTNTIISGLLWDGNAWEIYQAADDETLIILSSDALLTELKDVLGRKKFVPTLEKWGNQPHKCLKNCVPQHSFCPIMINMNTQKQPPRCRSRG